MGSGCRWRHNAGHMTYFLKKKNARKRCCFNCYIWPNRFTSHQSHYCLYYGVCEETFNVNRKIARTTQSTWNFIIRESNLQEMANFGDYPGDFRLQSGDREKRFKIWSLPDFPGELTALQSCYYMLHIPNSAGGNCLTGKENHSPCLKSDIKSINLRITKI